MRPRKPGAVPADPSSPVPRLSPSRPRRAAASAALGMAPLAFMAPSAWPQVLPYAVAAAFVFGLILLDLVADNALSRAVTAPFRRSEPGTAALPQALASRDVDQKELARFAADWTKAGADKDALTAAALQDPELWPRKLALAVLLESDGGRRERLMSAFDTAPHRIRRPPRPVLAEVLAGGSRALTLDPFRQRLALLAARFGLSPPAPRRSLARAGAAVLAGLALAGTLVFSGMAWQGAAQFRETQRREAAAAARGFYGKDAWIFDAHYEDARIRPEVLGPLERWHGTAPEDYARMENALRVLRDSHDPRSDEILAVVLANSEYLPLSGPADDLLYQTLAEREHEHFAKRMLAQLERSPEDPRTIDRALRLIRATERAGRQRNFQTLFMFLDSPAPRVSIESRKAAERMLDKEDADPLEQLDLVSLHYANDDPKSAPTHLWIARLALDRAGRTDAASRRYYAANYVKLSALIERTFGQVWFAFEDPETIDTAYRIVHGRLAPAMPDALREVAVDRVFRDARDLLKESWRARDDLREDMKRDRLAYDVEPEPPGSRRGDEDEDPLDQHFPRVFTLAQVKMVPGYLERVLEGDLSDEDRAFFESAAQASKRLIEIAEAAGVPAGGTRGEAAALRINARLARAAASNSPLPLAALLGPLRRAGLAPDVERPFDPQRSLKASYAAADLPRLDAVLAALAADPKLSWDARLLARRMQTEAREAADESLPGTVWTAPHAAWRARLSERLAALDAAAPGPARAEASAALERSLSEAPSLDLFLLEALAHADDAGARRAFSAVWLAEKAVALAAAGRLAPESALRPALPDGRAAQAEYWQAVARALAGGRAPTLLEQALLRRFDLAALELHLQTHARIFPWSVEGKGKEVRARLEASPRFSEGKFDDSRPWRLVHVRDLKALLPEAEAALAAADPSRAEDHRAFFARMDALAEALLAAGPRLAAVDGGSPAERAADQLHPRLIALFRHSAASGSRWYDALLERGLARLPPGADAKEGRRLWREEWQRRPFLLSDAYGERELEALSGLLEDTLRAGKGWTIDDTLTPLNTYERSHIGDLLERIDVLRGLPPVAATMAALAKDPAGPGLAAFDAALTDPRARAVLVARVLAVQERPGADPAVSRWLLGFLSDRAGGAVSRKQILDGEDAGRLWAQALDSLRGSNPALLVLDLEAALERAKGSPREDLLKEAVRRRFAGILNGAVVSPLVDRYGKGERLQELAVYGGSGIHLERFTLAGLERMEQAVDEAVAGLGTGPGARERSEDLHRIGRLIQDLARLGARVGIEAGDDPRAALGREFNGALYDLYQAFGAPFVNELREAGHAPKDGGFSREAMFNPGYSIDEAKAILGFTRRVLDSGQAWTLTSARTAMTGDQRSALRRAIARMEKALE